MSLTNAVNKLSENRGNKSLVKALMENKSPEMYVVVAEDFAECGIIVAALGVYISFRLYNPFYEGASQL